MAPDAAGSARPLVIGLAGAIGAGKSAAARAFERLGCIVSDSDRLARAALDRPDVLETLRSWWGDRVLAPGGGADRGAIAAVVFRDDAERRRLEGLIHPLVRRDREALIAAAAEAGAPAVIVDAPLLIEAGLDAECDLVVFVDAPRDTRLERVRARGWDAAELERRERAQLDPSEKRRRSHHVIDNNGPEEALSAAAARILRDAVASAAEGE